MKKKNVPSRASFVTHSQANKIRIKLILLAQKEITLKKKSIIKKHYENQKFVGEMLINNKHPSELFKPPTIKVEVNEEYNETTELFNPKNRKLKSTNFDKELKGKEIDYKTTNITNSVLKLKTSSYFKDKEENALSNDLSNKSKKSLSSIEDDNSEKEFDLYYKDLYKGKKRREKQKMKYVTPLVDKCNLFTEKDLFAKKQALKSYEFLQCLARSLNLFKRKDEEKFINFDVLRARGSYSSAHNTNPLIKDETLVIVKPKASPRKSVLGLVKPRITNSNLKQYYTINLNKRLSVNAYDDKEAKSLMQSPQKSKFSTELKAKAATVKKSTKSVAYDKNKNPNSEFCILYSSPKKRKTENLKDLLK